MRSRAAVRRALVGALVAGSLILSGAAPVEAHHRDEPLKILAVGDSKTVPGKWQGYMSNLLRNRNVGHRFVTAALGGTECQYWTPRIDALLQAHKPDLVIILCGTNDWKSGGKTTAAAMHSMIKKSKARGAHVLSAQMSYSDPNRAPAVLVEWEPRINAILRTEFSHHGMAAADLRSMYNGPTWTVDGVHSTNKGFLEQARRLYRAARAMMDWPRL